MKYSRQNISEWMVGGSITSNSLEMLSNGAPTFHVHDGWYAIQVTNAALFLEETFLLGCMATLHKQRCLQHKLPFSVLKCSCKQKRVSFSLDCDHLGVAMMSC